MLVGPLRLSLLAALAAFGAIGAALAMWGAGVPYLVAGLVAAALAGLTKIGPLALAPLLATYGLESYRTRPLRAAANPP